MMHKDEIQSSDSETQEIQFNVVDVKMLPELIQGQIGKIKYLDESVITALDAAKKAEEQAVKAKNRSAGRSLFRDKKKEAIEELQQAVIDLAEAVQSGAKAHKFAFELQARFADVTKYLFNLGVGNIAANRIVVRELELRLSGASKEQLSDLARQEVASVVRQLKEQEDLFQKQEQMKKGIKQHDLKIKYLQDQTDDLALGVFGSKDGAIRYLQDQTDDLALGLKDQKRALVTRIDTLDEGADAQQEEISDLKKQVVAHQADLATLITGLAQARSHSEQASSKLLARSEDLESRLKEQDLQQRAMTNMIESMIQDSSKLLAHSEDLESRLKEQDLQQRAMTNMIESMIQDSKQQQQVVLTLQEQVFTQQVSLEKLDTSLAKSRSVLNFRTALLVGLVMTLPAAAYFLR